MGKTNRKAPHGAELPDGGRDSRDSGRQQRSSGGVHRDTQISKKFSFLLRHGADKQGLRLGVGGYVNVADLLANQMVKSAHVTLEEVKRVVAISEKKRFGLAYIGEHDHDEAEGKAEAMTEREQSEGAPAVNQMTSATEAAVANGDMEPSHYLIRANQGHSIKLADASDLLTPITLEADNLPATVVHGTRHEVWPDILSSGGLKPMRRNHVHFATGVPKSLSLRKSGGPEPLKTESSLTLDVAALSVEEPSTPTVISGMRATSTILIFLDLRKALEKGLSVFLSENGVVLTEGDENGVVPMELFERVEEKSGQVLVEHGRVISELKGYAECRGKSKSKKTAKPKLNTRDRALDADGADLDE